MTSVIAYTENRMMSGNDDFLFPVPADSILDLRYKVL